MGIELYNGDCFDILPAIEPNSIDAIVTDPPYSSGGLHMGARQAPSSKYFTNKSTKLPLFAGDSKDQRSWTAWMHAWLRLGFKACKDGAIVCLFTDWRQLPSATDALQMAGFVWRGVVAWDKKNSMPQKGAFRNQCEYIIWGTKGEKNGKNTTVLSGAYQYSVPSRKYKQHATQKPVELMQDLLKIVPSNGTVLDPFMGSGTTLVACKSIGLHGIGIEYDPYYFEVAKNRIEETTEKGIL